MGKKSKKTGPARPAPVQPGSMLLKYRKTILLNEKELSAINRYCAKYKISSKSAFIRNAVLAHIMEDSDTNYPKLF